MDTNEHEWRQVDRKQLDYQVNTKAPINIKVPINTKTPKDSKAPTNTKTPTNNKPTIGPTPKATIPLKKFQQ